MAKYRKKPVVVDAVQFGPDTAIEMKDFIGKSGQICSNHTTGEVAVRIGTLEGVMMAHEGDYIIRGIKGEFYPVRKDIFEETYEKVDEETKEIDRDTVRAVLKVLEEEVLAE